MEPLFIALFVLWIAGALYDAIKFATLWQHHAFSIHRFSIFLSTETGKDMAKDFPVLGRIMYALAVTILTYHTYPSAVIVGTLFILVIGLAHNLCRCTHKRFPLPKEFTTKVKLIAGLSVLIELGVFFIIPDTFTLEPIVGKAPYVILLLTSLRFVITSTSVFLLSHISHQT